MKKRILVFFMVLLMGILTGCGMSEEEASEYVKASLDASYKGEFDAFVEITDSTVEGAKAMYEENITHAMEAAGFSDMNLSEEMTEKYRQFFFDICKMVDYKVGDAIKTRDGEFLVELTIRPLTTFSNLKEKEISKSVVSKIESMKKHPNDQKIVEITFGEIYKRLEENLNNPTYMEDEIIYSIMIYKNENDMYYIPEEMMIELDKLLFNLNNK